jgi:Uma2 family endonuclease
MSALAPSPPFDTVADVLDRAGGVPPSRVLYHPYPGTATEAHLVAALEREKRPCELVDGILVEKTMGYYESLLATVLIELLAPHVRRGKLGIVLGEAGALRLVPGLVRIPDVSFISAAKFPDRKLPKLKLLPLAPDLAVEVLSEGNTKAEMERKLREYFGAGSRLVWYVDPDPRTVRVFTHPDEVTLLGENDYLEGGDVIPGFRLRIGEWFDLAEDLGA